MSSGLYNTHKIDFDTTLDLTRLKPYGDTMNDGKVQTSFTLPIKDDERGEEAARQIAKKMGLEEPNVAYHAPLDKEFTFYVVYGSCVHSVNYEDIHVITVESDVMSMEDTNDYIREHIGRKVVMVGASTGTDAHTVGIDTLVEDSPFCLGRQTIDGKDYLLMKPIHADFALLGTYKCDEYGNCWYKGTMRNFNVVMATAADTVIAETEYLVPVGEIEPENVHTYGMCVNYIVEGDRK